MNNHKYNQETIEQCRLLLCYGHGDIEQIRDIRDPCRSLPDDFPTERQRRIVEPAFQQMIIDEEKEHPFSASASNSSS